MKRNQSIAPLIPVHKLSTPEIELLLAEIPAWFEIPTFIYNDQEESTLQYLTELKTSGIIHLVQIPYQVGKTEAIRQGLISLLQVSSASVVAQIDGRSKQPVYQVETLIQYLYESKAQMVIGNRYGQQNLEDQKHRLAGTYLFSALVEKFTDYKLQDTVCGTRAYVRELAQEFCQLRGFGYGLELEELIKASKKKYQVLEFALESNRQADATNAEKIEDNFAVLLSYSREVNMSTKERAILSYSLAQIKKRNSFDFPLSLFNASGSIVFSYVGSENRVDGYSNQDLKDGYSLTINE